MKKSKLSIFIITSAFLFAFSMPAFASGKLKVSNVNSKGEGLTGFKYEIKSENGKNIYNIDMTSTVETEIELPDGTYVISETQTLSGYDKSRPLKFSFPTENGGNALTYKPKHIETPKKPSSGGHHGGGGGGGVVHKNKNKNKNTVETTAPNNEKATEAVETSSSPSQSTESSNIHSKFLQTGSDSLDWLLIVAVALLLACACLPRKDNKNRK